MPLAHQRSPPCPARSRALFRRPSLASPICGSGWVVAPTSPQDETTQDETAQDSGSDDAEGGSGSDSDISVAVCEEKFAHPLHTYRIAGLCMRCQREREERLARFEVGSIRDGVERESELGRQRQMRRQRQRHSGEGEEDKQMKGKMKEKITGLGLRSGYVEGRRRGVGIGMILERSEKGELVDGRVEEDGEGEVDGELENRAEVEMETVAEAIGRDRETGAFEGRRSGNWHRRESLPDGMGLV